MRRKGRSVGNTYDKGEGFYKMGKRKKTNLPLVRSLE